MIVLAIDTGGAACSVALLRHDAVLARDVRPMARGHSEALTPQIAGALADAGLGFADIGLIGVTTGPGAFTGLRIGLAAAGGLGLATGAPIVGISSFDAVAAAVPDGPNPLLVVIESKREELFAQTYRPDGGREGGPLCLAPDAIDQAAPQGRVRLAGDGAARFLEKVVQPDRYEIVPNSDMVDPSVIARLALAGAGRAQADPPPPDYLRPPDAVPARPARARAS
ncbi:tRNA (adenosine(37)-N6)-threonylcarbamoyltransferase complex dimerization subunit type 1 TsaB [Inquilinus sp. CAU 1745]|uniref:tRNA (adenosine(37)-N6)-threonylcarbamoyltransferase complex dimerization subunit type 1 TsaB n=1 Tax=Inquilinus sp. CAU 1745 TaxID=3140369 RepID=UPI00325B50DF